MDINVDLFQWSINFFGKKTLGGTVKKENIWKKELAEELHKPVVRKFEKRKVHLHFIGNIWDADLAGQFPPLGEFPPGSGLGFGLGLR